MLIAHDSDLLSKLKHIHGYEKGAVDAAYPLLPAKSVMKGVITYLF
jgi:hypothetical protein